MGNNNCSFTKKLDQNELTIDIRMPNQKDVKISEEDEKEEKILLRNQSFPVSAKTGCEEDNDHFHKFFDSKKEIQAPDPPTLSSAPYNVLAKHAKSCFLRIKASQLKESDFIDSNSYKTLVNETGIYLGDLSIAQTRNGKGIQYWKNGGMYEGEWLDNQLNGMGRMIFANGDIYKGNWKSSKMHGNGKYNQTNGAFFDGNWKEGIQEGYGEETWPDGSEYKGNYSKGQKSGQGVYKCANGTIYTGDFVRDKMEGEGVMTWPDKREYKGKWQDNQMHGVGEFLWPDGRKFKGEYKDNLKEGYGEFFYGDGRVFKGNWKAGFQHGIGAFTAFDAKGNEVTKAGEWFQGKRIRWLKSLTN